MPWRQKMRRWIDGAQFSTQFKKKRWDGHAYPGRINRHAEFVIGRGLLERVLQDTQATITVPPPPAPNLSLDLGGERLAKLYDYQREALQKIFIRKWGCIALATNAGKGAIIALAAKVIGEKVGRVLVCCDEIAVFDALKQEIEKWTGESPGLVRAGWRVPPQEPVVLAMIPTLYNRTDDDEWKEWFGEIKAVFLDEADKAVSKSWQKILDRLPNTLYRIGTSGTFPEREDPAELKIHETIGPILTRVKNIELVERGISAKPCVELIPYSHDLVLPPRDAWKGMTGPQRRLYVYEQAVVLNEDRHRFIISLLEPNEPNAIIVNYLEHGRQLAQVIPDSQFLNGEDLPEVRTRVLEQFRRREFQNLIVSKILDRGTNELGHTVGLIFASAQGSNRQTLQRIGRGLRRAGGKEFLFLKDVIDRGYTYLESASAQRVRLYNAEGFEIQIRG